MRLNLALDLKQKSNLKNETAFSKTNTGSAMWKFPCRLVVVCQMLPVHCLTLSGLFNFPAVKNLKESSLLVLLKLSLCPCYKQGKLFFFSFLLRTQKIQAGRHTGAIRWLSCCLPASTVQMYGSKGTASTLEAKPQHTLPSRALTRLAAAIDPLRHSNRIHSSGVPLTGGPGLRPQERRIRTSTAFLLSSGAFVWADKPSLLSFTYPILILLQK